MTTRGTWQGKVVVLTAVGLVICGGGCRSKSADRASASARDSQDETPIMSNVTPAQAKQILDSMESYVYLDVRTVEEFEAGHIPGSWNVPVAVPDADGQGMQLNADFMATIEAKFGKDQRMIVGCKAGGRSAAAVQLLQQAGFPNTHNMLGGFGGSDEHQGWSQLGYPTGTGAGGERSYAELLPEK